MSEKRLQIGETRKQAWVYRGPNETFAKHSILFKVKGNSAGKRNWTAVRLPARAIPQDCGRVNARILTTGIL
jgi:hypothetical protein